MRGHRPAQKASPAARRGFMGGERLADETQPLDIVVDHGSALLDHAHHGIGDGGIGRGRGWSQRNPRWVNRDREGCQRTQ